FNTSRINSFASNYSSIVPSDLISHLSFSSLKKSVPVYVLSHSRIDVNKKQIQPEINKEGPQSPDINSTPVPAPENPAVTSPESTPTSNAGQPAVQHHYLIIGGAFKVKENAEKFIAQLKAKNLNATIAGQNKKGLYMVSVASYDDAGQANLSLKELSGKGIESAWILNNQKL
ncbi:MAG: SPOR domain-containing protein, partial [Bacteroidota bacterium]|nr:SPOR domain-containing protein [Bacteroidota bacterium]